MKRFLFTGLKKAVIIAVLISPAFCFGQKENLFIRRYLTNLPKVSEKRNNEFLKYSMTAVYTNRDLYGNFTSKTKVTGEYTRGLPGDSAIWNNVYIAASQKFEEPFSSGSKQIYIENFKYKPSEKMVKDPLVFSSFPPTPESVFTKNLIWDMMSIETFAWNYYDSLKLNHSYIIPNISGQFKMADIGNYSHQKIQLCWQGMSQINNELCAIIEFTAIDNKIEMSMEQMKTKGTEQYWGTILVSLKTKEIENAIMYSGTIQEIEIKGLKDKFLIKTIRELEVTKIQ
jgi:hypothetical protein